MQKHVNLVDLVKKIITSIYYLLAKIDVDTAENEPVKVLREVGNLEATKSRASKSATDTRLWSLRQSYAES